MKLFTIGSNEKKAEDFFTLIKHYGIKRVLDVRLNNDSHFTSFARMKHLTYFLDEICNCDYMPIPMLAPTKEIFYGYISKKISWEEYTVEYNALLKSRKVENSISLDDLNQSCLLCSEPTADMCHRRLAAEYLNIQYKQLKISHI